GRQSGESIGTTAGRLVPIATAAVLAVAVGRVGAGNLGNLTAQTAAMGHEAAVRGSLMFATFNFLGVGKLLPEVNLKTGKLDWHPGQMFTMGLGERIAGLAQGYRMGLNIGAVLAPLQLQGGPGSLLATAAEAGPTGLASELVGLNATKMTTGQVLRGLGYSVGGGAVVGAGIAAAGEISRHGLDLGSWDFSNVAVGAAAGAGAGGLLFMGALGLRAASSTLESALGGTVKFVANVAEGAANRLGFNADFATAYGKAVDKVIADGASKPITMSFTKGLNRVAEITGMNPEIFHLVNPEGLFFVHTAGQIGSTAVQLALRAVGGTLNEQEKAGEVASTVFMLLAPGAAFGQQVGAKALAEGRMDVARDVLNNAPPANAQGREAVGGTIIVDGARVVVTPELVEAAARVYLQGRPASSTLASHEVGSVDLLALSPAGLRALGAGTPEVSLTSSAGGPRQGTVELPGSNGQPPVTARIEARGNQVALRFNSTVSPEMLDQVVTIVLRGRATAPDGSTSEVQAQVRGTIRDLSSPTGATANVPGAAPGTTFDFSAARVVTTPAPAAIAIVLASQERHGESGPPSATVEAARAQLGLAPGERVVLAVEGPRGADGRAPVRELGAPPTPETAQTTARGPAAETSVPLPGALEAGQAPVSLTVTIDAGGVRAQSSRPLTQTELEAPVTVVVRGTDASGARVETTHTGTVGDLLGGRLTPSAEGGRIGTDPTSGRPNVTEVQIVRGTADRAAALGALSFVGPPTPVAPGAESTAIVASPARPVTTTHGPAAEAPVTIFGEPGRAPPQMTARVLPGGEVELASSRPLTPTELATPVTVRVTGRNAAGETVNFDVTGTVAEFTGASGSRPAVPPEGRTLATEAGGAPQVSQIRVTRGTIDHADAVQIVLDAQNGTGSHPPARVAEARASLGLRTGEQIVVAAQG
ncbi:MAG: hypothetical protein JO102_06515, partial [Elusimicrobia bacterium]|nr:hypothetical protein [Elusimicrobiota bacterium]